MKCAQQDTRCSYTETEDAATLSAIIVTARVGKTRLPQFSHKLTSTVNITVITDFVERQHSDARY